MSKHLEIKSRKFDVNGVSERLCLDVYQHKISEVLLTSLMAIVLTIASLVIDRSLKMLSSFEKHTDLNEESKSRIVKGTVLKFLNSGVLIVFINYRFHFFGNTSLGNYDDVTPIWFLNIGYSIVLAAFLKLIMLIFWTGFRAFMPWCSRCCDRGCTCNYRKTRRKTLKDQLLLYTGMEFDIDFSYSETIKVMLTCMMFGSILPIIYVISVLHLIILFWRDKIFCKFFQYNTSVQGLQTTPIL